MSSRFRFPASVAFAIALAGCTPAGPEPEAGPVDEGDQLLLDVRGRVEAIRAELDAARSGQLYLQLGAVDGELDLKLKGTELYEARVEVPDPPPTEGCRKAAVVSRDPVSVVRPKAGPGEVEDDRLTVADMPDRYTIRFRCEESGREFDLSFQPSPGNAAGRAWSRVMNSFRQRSNSVPTHAVYVPAEGARQVYWSVDGPAALVLK